MTNTLGDLVEIGTYPNEFTAGVIRAKLEDAGIPAQSIASNQALIGAFGQTGWLPFSVWVRGEDVERAHALLEEVRAAQGTVDWDSVDVGDPDPTDALAKKVAAGGKSGLSLHARLAGAGLLLVASWVMLELSGTFGGAWSMSGFVMTMVAMAMLVGACGLAISVMFAKKRPAQPD